ncbi:hypothetical protein FDP41_007009 [Naegleria fowleri]|uniref:Uncharacterized protein n=1 Tax=Naegleria fowleri TaxID=5763 RepID=A0A6A5B9J8_NAEFO|nr:uncharacterized protein FDP41_007009 [Naegleria fowleri]KAF0973977.1 hypothetical protein FDP41_007009 [Naegleria fowleri]
MLNRFSSALRRDLCESLLPLFLQKGLKAFKTNNHVIAITRNVNNSCNTHHRSYATIRLVDHQEERRRQQQSEQEHRGGENHDESSSSQQQTKKEPFLTLTQFIFSVFQLLQHFVWVCGKQEDTCGRRSKLLSVK